ncbi:Cytochrome c oxidase subunit 5B, mitochondrial [Aspergillus melleus]|uniref:Cytochrome c oxidase subunit 5B, mitochondrial n=1 Tax=Aspergillus melleus TaxID=138277 RepID=UPI001E8CF99B|nr:Cytochrome c oxidase subunit 5B, mitochondrial [Aspergillus melleus]KAH8434037.1 Cytochrome c oxidase subunit 5B, mitochondrial [Aspergillus melleus]
MAGGQQRVRSGTSCPIDLLLHQTDIATPHPRRAIANDPSPQQREKINPIYGISAQGYEGPGFVQSPPAEKS